MVCDCFSPEFQKLPELSPPSCALIEKRVAVERAVRASSAFKTPVCPAEESFGVENGSFQALGAAASAPGTKAQEPPAFWGEGGTA